MENVYNEIAREWDEYRQKPLSAVRLLLSYVGSGAVCLDAGTGNGRHLQLLCEKFEHVYALDNSEKLFEIAKAKHYARKVNFFLCDVCMLPFQENFFDAVFCTGVIHHLKQDETILAFNEFHRTLKPGGLLLGTTWNKFQERFAHVDGKDALVPWTMKNGTKVDRFIRFWEKEDVEALATDAGFDVVKIFYEINGTEHERNDASNLCFVLKKPA